MKKNAKILRKLTAFPFLLVFLAFLFPLVNISCAEKVVANPNTYELVSGVTPETFLGEKERKAVVLAAICAFFTPVGSLAMALAAFVSLWVFIYNLSVTIQTEHYDFLTVKPAVGAYCITFLLIIGIAMNLTVIIRTAREKRQELGTEELK